MEARQFPTLSVRIVLEAHQFPVKHSKVREARQFPMKHSKVLEARQFPMLSVRIVREARKACHL